MIKLIIVIYTISNMYDVTMLSNSYSSMELCEQDSKALSHFVPMQPFVYRGAVYCMEEKEAKEYVASLDKLNKDKEVQQTSQKLN